MGRVTDPCCSGGRAWRQRPPWPPALLLSSSPHAAGARLREGACSGAACTSLSSQLHEYDLQPYRLVLELQ